MLDEADMVFPSWTVRLAAGAVIPALVGIGVAMAAPAPGAAVLASPFLSTDDSYRPGETGVDLTAVTGPTASQVSAARGCDDPSWPIVPFSCREGAQQRD